MITQLESSCPPGEDLDFPALLRAFATNVEGATAIEYALLASMFVTLLIGSSSSLRSSLLTMYNSITNSVANAN